MIAVNGAFLPGDLGGVQRFAFQLLEALLTAAPELQLRIYVPGSARPAGEPIDALRRLGADVISGPPWAARKQVFEQVALPRLAAAAGAERLLHLAGGLTVASRLAQTSVLYDLAPVRLPRTFRPAYRAKFRAVLHAAHRRSVDLVTLSRFSAAEFAGAGLTAAVLPTAVGSPQLQRLLPQVEASAAPPQLAALPRPYALLTGTADPRKRAGDVIDAWSVVRARTGLTLVVLEGARTFRRALASSGFAAGHHHPGVVRLRGQMSDLDLVRLTAGAELAIFPSRYEGSALAAQEALALGTRVLTSDIPPFRELLPEGTVTCRTPPAPTEVADACAAALAGPEPLRRSLAEVEADWRVVARSLAERLRS